jgi:hypothetical protein
MSENLKYDNDVCNQFVTDMVEAGLEVEHYNGRYMWHGPAVRTNDDFDMQDIIRATKVKLQNDTMGLGYILYPIQSGNLIEEEFDSNSGEGNVKLNEGFTQVCVWPSTIVGEESIKNFENWIKEDFDVRCQYLEEIKTRPDVKDSIGKTGSRNDLIFAIHSEDIQKFAVPRLNYGISWIEDALAHDKDIYPARIAGYKSW